MGLDFQPSTIDGRRASWSYGCFHRFRVRLAREIGIDLESMAGFGDNGLPWDNIIDPIIHLLHHSDCDGHLSPEQCTIVAPRLLELVTRWEDDYDKRNARVLAEIMELCAESGKQLEFC